MGDATTEVTATEKVPTERATSPQTPSCTVNPLHPSRPSENIAVTKDTPNVSEEKIEKIHDDTFSGESLPKIDAFLASTLEGAAASKSDERIRHRAGPKKPEDERKPLIDSLVVEKSAARDRFLSKSSPVTPVVVEKKTRVGSAASGLLGERVNRNQSDIFSLKEETSMASSIFSVNGSPSRKVYRRKEATANNVFPLGVKEEPPSEKVSSPPGDKARDTKESYNELRRPSSSLRNPLTGTGLSSNDEYKFKGNKRKDGNPLLGLGYSPEATPSAHRIPPGGFSHKLW